MSPARNPVMTAAIAAVLSLSACTAADRDRVAGAPGRSASPETRTDGPTDLVGVRGPLDPGTYAMGVWGGKGREDSQRRAVVQVPEGYFSQGGYVIDAGSDGSPEAEQFGEVSVWDVEQVLTDPCDVRTAVDVGPTVADLAEALTEQAGPHTRPRPVELDGHHGLFLEVRMANLLDLSRCTNGEHTLWLTDDDGSGQGQGHAGVTYQMWIVDIDGTRLVALATLFPGQASAQHDEQIAMARGLHFVVPTRG